MNGDEFLKKYLELSGEKSGVMFSGGKCLYLFGNQYCEVNCRRLIFKSGSTEIFAESHSDLSAWVCGSSCAAYVGGMRAVRFSELLILCEIPLDNSTLYAVLTGGSNFPAGTLRFCGKDVAELILRLTETRNFAEQTNGKALAETLKTLNLNDVRALSEMYLSAKPGKELLK